MATQSGKAPTKRSKGASKRSKSTGRGRALPSGKAAKRSAHTAKGTRGRRTTLRVPDTLDKEVSVVSRELGISGNEALVRLAALGAERARLRREVRRVIERRRSAVLGLGDFDPKAPLPSEEEGREAILADRA